MEALRKYRPCPDVDKHEVALRKALLLFGKEMCGSLERTMGDLLKATNGKLQNGNLSEFQNKRAGKLFSHNNWAERQFVVVKDLALRYCTLAWASATCQPLPIPALMARADRPLPNTPRPRTRSARNKQWNEEEQPPPRIQLPKDRQGQEGAETQFKETQGKARKGKVCKDLDCVEMLEFNLNDGVYLVMGARDSRGGRRTIDK
jgi:hypothetical protein